MSTAELQTKASDLASRHRAQAKQLRARALEWYARADEEERRVHGVAEDIERQRKAAEKMMDDARGCDAIAAELEGM